MKRRFLIQTKLVLLVLITSSVILLLNLGIYYKTDRMMNKVDQVFLTNVKLNQLQEKLEAVHLSMTQYLYTKSSDSMEQYYETAELYKECIETLNPKVIDSETLLMEKNIRNLSETYLEFTQQTVEAKRGRNVERYNQSYEESQDLYEIINTFIYSLNNTQFQENSAAYERLLTSVRNSERANLVIILAVGLLDVFVVSAVTGSIMYPLRQLANAANEVSEGNMDVAIESSGRDEIAVVTAAFGRMLTNLNRYIEEIRKNAALQNEMKERELRMKADLKESQLKYLQAQVNPHFLFNTLNAGVQLAMMEGAQRTYDYIQNVADFYRYNIKALDREQVTLARELAMLDNYIYILNVRFSGEIQMEKIIDERYLRYPIPKMILQPVVENCVNHGIRGIDWPGKITVRIGKEGEKLCISISDNGVGIAADMIQKVMKLSVLEEEVKSQSNGVGLANVIRRLRLFYQEEDIVEITSAGENLGTEIAFFLPLKLKEGTPGEEKYYVSDHVG